MRFSPTTKSTLIYTLMIAGLNLAHHFPFQNWLYELFQSIHSPILMFSALWAFFLLYKKNKIQSLLIFGILCFQFLMIFQLKKPLKLEKANGKNTFKVMSTNLLIFNSSLDEVIEDILQSNPETVSMLELTSTQWLYFKEHPKLTAIYPYQILKNHIPEQFGIGVISKYPFVSQNWIYTTIDKIPTANITQLTKIGLVEFIITHAHSPLGPTGYTQRNIHLKEIANLKHPTKQPYFVMGDFNMTRWSPWFQKFLKLSNLNFNPTNDFWNHTWYLFPYVPLGIHIDHFFYNDKIRVVDTRIGPYAGSDHRSLTVTMKAHP